MAGSCDPHLLNTDIMSKVIRVFATKNGTFLTTIEYNGRIKTSLGTQVVRDWFSIELEEDLTDKELPDFNPKDFVIEERTSIKKEEVADPTTGEITVVETEYINKWLFPK